jgi:hypothetical protein
MIFDRELCFIHEGPITAFSGGVIGDPLDLGAPNQTGKGRPSYVAIACQDDTTATGNPVITLSLEFSEDEAFTTPVPVPLSLPTLKKEDLAKGSCVVALSPMFALRYVRLILETDIDIACSTMTAGFVLDPQTNR